MGEVGWDWSDWEEIWSTNTKAGSDSFPAVVAAVEGAVIDGSPPLLVAEASLLLLILLLGAGGSICFDSGWTKLPRAQSANFKYWIASGETCWISFCLEGGLCLLSPAIVYII